MGKVKKNVYKFHHTAISYSDINYIIRQDTSLAKNDFFNIPDLLYSGMISTGNVEITRGESEIDSNFAVYQMNNIKIEADGNNAMFYNLSELEQGLTFPFLAYYDVNGKLLSWYHSKDINEMTARFIGNFLNATLFINQKRNLQDWDTEEQNGTGIYAAHYTQLNKSGFLEFTKSKSDFVYKARDEIDHKFDLTSFSTFIFNPLGILDSLNLSESIITINNTDTINATASKLTVKSIPITVTDSFLADQLLALKKNSTAKQSLINYKSKDEVDKSIYKVTLGQDNLDSLLIRLAKPFQKEERKSIITKFRALFYLFPETCKEALNRSYIFSENEEKISVLIQALINCQKPYCTDPLIDYLTENMNDENLIYKTLPIISLTKTPTKKLLGLVTNLLADTFFKARSFRNTFKLAYCNIFRNFRKADISVSQTMLPALSAFIEQTTDTLFKIRLMGNTADSLYYDSLIHYSDSGCSEEIRLAAIDELIQYDASYSVSIEKHLSSLLIDKNQSIAKSAAKIIEERKTKRRNF